MKDVAIAAIVAVVTLLTLTAGIDLFLRDQCKKASEELNLIAVYTTTEGCYVYSGSGWVPLSILKAMIEDGSEHNG